MRHDSPEAREERKQSLLAAIAGLPQSRSGDKPGSTKVTFDTMDAAYSVVLQAAKARRMSVAAYARRAAMAMAAHDLHLPLTEVVERDPRISRENGFTLDVPLDKPTFGLWEIERLIGEEPE